MNNSSSRKIIQQKGNLIIFSQRDASGHRLIGLKDTDGNIIVYPNIKNMSINIIDDDNFFMQAFTNPDRENDLYHRLNFGDPSESKHLYEIHHITRVNGVFIPVNTYPTDTKKGNMVSPISDDIVTINSLGSYAFYSLSKRRVILSDELLQETAKYTSNMTFLSDHSGIVTNEKGMALFDTVTRERTTPWFTSNNGFTRNCKNNIACIRVSIPYFGSNDKRFQILDKKGNIVSKRITELSGIIDENGVPLSVFADSRTGKVYPITSSIEDLVAQISFEIELQIQKYDSSEPSCNSYPEYTKTLKLGGHNIGTGK